jgi:hypothetical protein
MGPEDHEAPACQTGLYLYQNYLIEFKKNKRNNGIALQIWRAKEILVSVYISKPKDFSLSDFFVCFCLEDYLKE